MALIKCSECGKEISDRAESCPNCGCPIDEEEDEKKEKGNLSYEILCLIISIFATIIAFAINDGIGLIVPFVLYVLSIVLGIKRNGKISFVGILIFGFGITLCIIELIKPFFIIKRKQIVCRRVDVRNIVVLL